MFHQHAAADLMTQSALLLPQAYGSALFPVPPALPDVQSVLACFPVNVQLSNT